MLNYADYLSNKFRHNNLDEMINNMGGPINKMKTTSGF